MKKYFDIIKIIVILVSTILLSSCTEKIISAITENKSRPGSVSFINIKTGLTDSTDYGSMVLTEKEVDSVIKIMESGGFTLSWDRVKDADYYEIRISRNKITIDNWDKASIAAIVDNKGNSDTITYTIKELKPKIKQNECIGCGYCVTACPNNAITIKNNRAIIDLTKCTGCGKCYDTCNYYAIEDNIMNTFYYFAIRAFYSNKVGSEKIATTDDAYTLRYKNNKKIMKKIGPVEFEANWCGHCKYEGCYINMKKYGNGCPVNALYADSTGFIHIDYSKCISCGKCMIQCATSPGFFSIRKAVISSKEAASLQ